MIKNIYHPRKLSPLFKVLNISSVYHITFDKDHHVKGEFHNFWEFVYVLEGTIGITADQKIFELYKGQIVFHKPGEFHNLWSAKKSNPTVFIMSFTLDGPLKELENTICSLTNFESQIINQLIIETACLTTLVDQETTIMSLACHDESFNGLNHLIKNYLELLILYIIKNHHASKFSFTTPTQIHYEKITSYIQTNLFSKLNIDMICENCNIGPTTLKTLFRKHLGMSAMEYVNQLKIQTSMDLLCQGLSHQEIADLLSFSSPYYFSTVFKRIVGVSPKQYKNTN